ncbi:class I SAM-dependent methyltransferase [Aquibium carbonis]|uniref:Class I SAM-dependent methyltransferase n=1 Tax=Aquibium carbonis TaxID=2495581 RepID=A0A3R9YQ40_9HYPH|nr:class I SAM-dependent methyltransferase [Aquibium carbonis]RST84451.1 class I SAM-dependent methyltransferase [Aquibium carbonis]
MERAAPDHAELMDGVYRVQRHFYDATRKYYLLGRDRMIDGLDVPNRGTVLELGCGTGRNLVLAARRYPRAQFFGLDISSEMLATARTAIDRAGLAGRVALARADATRFEARDLFDTGRFDRVFISYALSMIPGWERTIALGIDALAPGGSLHIVDFGGQERLPTWFRAGLRTWLAKFHVSPRDELHAVLCGDCERTGANLSFEPLFRGYAVHAVVRARAIPAH